MSVAKELLKENELSLLQFWDSRRAGRTMPERSDFKPEDLYPWLGYLHLLEPIDGGRDFRYVIFTTRTLIGKDKDMTGKCVSDWGDDRVVHAIRLYRSVVDLAKPVYNAIPERHEDDWGVYSRICLPLGTQDTVTHVVSMLTPVKGDYSNPIQPTVIEP